MSRQTSLGEPSLTQITWSPSSTTSSRAAANYAACASVSRVGGRTILTLTWRRDYTLLTPFNAPHTYVTWESRSLIEAASKQPLTSLPWIIRVKHRLPGCLRYRYGDHWTAGSPWCRIDRLSGIRFRRGCWGMGMRRVLDIGFCSLMKGLIFLECPE